MPLIMTRDASVKCPHGGTGINIPSQDKVFVNGIPVMVDGDRGTIQGCAFPPAGPPCISYDLNSMRLNSSYIDSKNIMLVTDYVISNTGFPLIITETHFVEDNTSTAPVEPGETPRMPAFSLHLTKPIVSVVPSFGEFSKSSPVPSLLFTFSLNSLFPLNWKLTKLNKQVFADIQDFTESASVTPRGGEWDANTMQIVLLLDGLYMQSLILGDHYFILVGIDQRGNAGSIKAKLSIKP